MSASPFRMMEDMVRLAGGMAGNAVGLRDEVDAQMKMRMEQFLSRFDLVTREEFDAMAELAAKSAAQVEELSNRVAEMEAKLAAKPAAPRKSAPKKTAATRSKSPKAAAEKPA